MCAAPGRIKGHSEKGKSSAKKAQRSVKRYFKGKYTLYSKLQVVNVYLIGVESSLRSSAWLLSVIVGERCSKNAMNETAYSFYLMYLPAPAQRHTPCLSWGKGPVFTLPSAACLPVCLSLSLSVCLSVFTLPSAACLPVCLSVSLSVCLSVLRCLMLPACLYVGLFLCLHACLFVRCLLLPVRLSVCLFFCLPASLPACMPSCLSVCLLQSQTLIGVIETAK